MKVIGRIKQIKVLFFLAFAIFLAFYCRDILAREALPTETKPPAADAVSTITPEESESQLQDAMLLFNRGKTDAAIYRLQQTQKADPTNYKVLFKLGEMAIAARNWAYAINVLRKASFIRPKDIEVRLILMDVYTAYQMPIQEIIVGKEILVLDPTHITATRRLARLYQEQAMPDDEIEIRKILRQLVPEDYENLKRLADAFFLSGELWESARIYEEIRKYYPEKTEDMANLAEIYNKIEEPFRVLQVLNQIKKNGKSLSWLKNRTIKSLRAANKVYDPFHADLTFRKENSEEMDIFTTTTTANYDHIRINSSFDVGMDVKLSKLHHSGRKILDGRMDIDSGTIVGRAIKRWRGEDYMLESKLGLLWDEVHGKLKPRDPSTGGTPEDFPFFKDPSFNSYGGVMPVWGLTFEAQPGMHASYQISYERNQLEDLDARLRMFYYDKTTLSYTYTTDDYTEFIIQADETAISDGNFLFHGMASVNYLLWGSSPIKGYHDILGIPIFRKGFWQNPINFIKIGYEYEYYDTESKSVNYEVYKTEDRHKYQIEAQVRLLRLGKDNNLIFNSNFGYSNGSTLDLQRNVGARLLYRESGSNNEIGLSFDFEEAEETNVSENLRVSGSTRSSTVSAFINWRF